MNPYIGITGFMNRDEVSAVLSVLPEESSRKLMVGVLASSNTITGVPNKWPNRYPEPKQLGKIFLTHPKALNLIHFNTREPEFLYEHMARVRELAGKNCHGFQLNVTWPDPVVLRKMMSSRPDTTIVLQIGARAFEEVGHSPQVLADKIASRYIGLIDYILLDASGGHGKRLEVGILTEYLRALTSRQLLAGLGVAGGLNPYTLHLLLKSLISEFPNLSIDAEGKLRNEGDHLDVSLASEYVRKALDLFKNK